MPIDRKHKIGHRHRVQINMPSHHSRISAAGSMRICRSCRRARHWAMAMNYAHKQWPKITVYVEEGRFRVDNNLTENEIRPFVIGRKSACLTQLGHHAVTNTAGKPALNVKRTSLRSGFCYHPVERGRSRLAKRFFASLLCDERRSSASLWGVRLRIASRCATSRRAWPRRGNGFSTWDFVHRWSATPWPTPTRSDRGKSMPIWPST